MFRALPKSLLLAIVALLLTNVVLARAAPEEEDGVARFSSDEADELYAAPDTAAGGPQYVSRVLFLNVSSQSFPSFPAGSKAHVVVAFQNSDNDDPQVVFLVIGLLQPPQQYHTVIQNFSAVRQARKVRRSETVSMHYTFTADPRLEPGEYNLVLGLYVQNSATNQTYFVTAFNSTIILEEPLGTDPRMVLTYLTLLAIFACIAYVAANKLGLVKMIKTMMHSKAGSSWNGTGAKHVEMGTGGTSYDPAYINAEHQRYRDEVLRQKSSAPHSRHASASPKKKN
ncbi:hypothetical protein LSCM1_02872 [Leishmania martiniquensis]|uniref:Signal sequence receptor subunit alpha n=1 Tax=Leishmania martiniquensis TaxID=1580590 RepID=A0A836KKG9_9TRYP|nr:hypothetical protein LSCM1_02872 [Leishmania martiniquensis]